MFGGPNPYFRPTETSGRNFCMANFSSFLSVALLIVGCAAAGPNTGGSAPGQAEPPAQDKPVVLTTFTVIADIAQNVAGDLLDVASITKVGAEIHGYEPTPGDLRRAADADLILDNGLNLEAWFGRFVAGLDVPHVVVSEGVEAILIAEDAYAGLPNPHAWMSTLNARIYVDNMAAAFAELDPEHAEVFDANAAAYKVRLDEVHEELLADLGALGQSQRALVSCEGAFSYLARDTELTEAYIWPVNAEQQSTPQRVAAVIEFVRDRDVPAVFCESTVSDEGMQQVAAESGARFGGTLYVDSLSESSGPVPTYLDLLRYDAELIIEGLTGTGS